MLLTLATASKCCCWAPGSECYWCGPFNYDVVVVAGHGSKCFAVVFILIFRILIMIGVFILASVVLLPYVVG